MKRKRLNLTTQWRVEWLKENEHPETVYSNKALSHSLQVTRATVISWRNKGIIKGEEVAPGLWLYRMGDVLNSLSKYCK